MLRTICHDSGVLSAHCPAVVQRSKRSGRADHRGVVEVCGRPVVGFLAHGHGRCGYHLTTKERVRVLATIRAEREMLELRGLMRKEPASCEDASGPDCDDGAEPDVDAERFSGPELDE